MMIQPNKTYYGIEIYDYSNDINNFWNYIDWFV